MAIKQHFPLFKRRPHCIDTSISFKRLLDAQEVVVIKSVSSAKYSLSKYTPFYLALVVRLSRLKPTSLSITNITSTNKSGERGHPCLIPDDWVFIRDLPSSSSTKNEGLE